MSRRRQRLAAGAPKGELDAYVATAHVRCCCHGARGGRWAQAPVTAADLTRLETTAAEIGRQVTALGKTDARSPPR